MKTNLRGSDGTAPVDDCGQCFTQHQVLALEAMRWPLPAPCLLYIGWPETFSFHREAFESLCALETFIFMF